MLCTIDNCQKEATHTFVWPWGAEGACCQDHVVVVQQKARNARGRMGQVSFTRLDPDRPREVRRDERIELHAAKLTAEAERDEAKLRAQKLFDVNTGLTRELQAARARGAQFEVKVRELADQVIAAVHERDAALVKLDDALAECERLGVKTEPPPASPASTHEPPPASPARDEAGRFQSSTHVGFGPGSGGRPVT